MENFSLVDVISTAVQVPGVKVSRATFLCEIFEDAEPVQLQHIVKDGPVAAGYSREDLRRIARKLIKERALASGGVSFLAGLPGGLAMAATIPADVLQFYGITLRMAQELAYLYGEDDLWTGDAPDDERIVSQLILYCGAMLGVSGAVQGVRLLSSPLAEQAMNRLPQKALTKAFYAPFIRSISQDIGGKMTMEIFAKSLVKVLPVLGGVVSGGITLTTMRPMGQRLANALEQAQFSYNEDRLESDWADMMDVIHAEAERQRGMEIEITVEPDAADVLTEDAPLEGIQKAKELLDAGVITEQEFTKIKSKLIAKL